MNNADAGWNYLEGIECLHAPLHEFVTFAVTLEFQFHIQLESIRAVVIVNLHRVIHHEVNRNQRLDDFRVAAASCCRITHRGKIS